MKNIIERKCNACKQAIKIHSDNIKDVVYYKKLYYHSECFHDMAERKSQQKRGNPAEWKAAIDNIEQFERDAVNVLSSRLSYLGAKDDLNDYLLSQYNVVSVPDRFWQVVADLNNGIYKHKRCKKISTDVLLETWKWGQHKLNEINKKNKMSHKGPTDDAQRIPYDLAILVTKVPNYLAHKAKQEAMVEEMKREISSRIDYNNIHVAESKSEGLDDISDILNEW